MKITCEHTFCIYQKKGKCLLDAIEVGESGLCRSCIAAPVDEDELALAKGAAADALRAHGYCKSKKLEKTLAFCFCLCYPYSN